MNANSVLVCSKCFDFTAARTIGSVVPRSVCAMCGDTKTGYEVPRTDVPFTEPPLKRKESAQQPGIDS